MITFEETIESGRFFEDPVELGIDVFDFEEEIAREYRCEDITPATSSPDAKTSPRPDQLYIQRLQRLFREGEILILPPCFNLNNVISQRHRISLSA